MPKLLFIDTDLKIMKKCWEKHFAVQTAETAAAAIRPLTAESFSLVVLEPMLPRLPQNPNEDPPDYNEGDWQCQVAGNDILRRIRQGDFAPAGNPASLPIIVWTVMSKEEEGYSLALRFKPDRIVDALIPPSTLTQVCQELLGSGEK